MKVLADTHILIWYLDSLIPYYNEPCIYTV